MQPGRSETLDRALLALMKLEPEDLRVLHEAVISRMHDLESLMRLHRTDNLRAHSRRLFELEDVISVAGHNRGAFTQGSQVT